MGRLENKVAVITGAAKGLGEADARLFVQEGAKVVMTDVDATAGEALARDLGDNAIFLKHDVRNEDEWVRVIDEAVSRFGRLDILVNNAGVVEVGNIESQTTEEWRFVNAVSADGTFFGCKYAVKAMKESGGGSIVNMASLASLQGEPIFAAYCAAKGAVEALTRAVAVHCAQMKYNIRCNSIHPAGIQTPMVADVPVKMAKAMEQGFQPPTMQATGETRLGEPNDVANAVVFLASDESKFINGTRIVVDNTMSVTSGNVPA